MLPPAEPVPPAGEDPGQRLVRLRWPGQPFCPFCGRPKPCRLRPPAAAARLPEKPESRPEAGPEPENRPGRKQRWKCSGCRRQFTVTTATILEGSRLSLADWIWLAGLVAQRQALPGLADLRPGRPGHPLGRTGAGNTLQRLAYAWQHGPLADLFASKEGEATGPPGTANSRTADSGADDVLRALLLTLPPSRTGPAPEEGAPDNS